MISETEDTGVCFIINYIKSKSISCEYDFDNTYYYGGSNDVTTIITPICKIKFTENAYNYNDNDIIMCYNNKYIYGMSNIIQEIDNIFI